MAIISPLTFFRFAADHSELLERLYEKRSRLTEAELRDFVCANRKDTDPAPQHIINQLEELGIIEPSPEATAAYEMRRPVAQLMAYLLHARVEENKLESAKEELRFTHEKLKRRAEETDRKRQSLLKQRQALPSLPDACWACSNK